MASQTTAQKRLFTFASCLGIVLVQLDVSIVNVGLPYYEPEQLIGKDVLFVANFAQRKMMGIENQGKILSAVNFDGSLNVTSLLGKVKPGSQVG